MMTIVRRAGLVLLSLSWLVAAVYAQNTPAPDAPTEKPAPGAPLPPAPSQPDSRPPQPSMPVIVPLAPPAGPSPPSATPFPAPIAPPGSMPPPQSGSTPPVSAPPATTPNASAQPSSLDLQIPQNNTAPSFDSSKRNLGSPASAQSLRALKRLSREEIHATTNHSLSTYVLRDNERTLVLDFPNLREQARTFARLILFIERAGTSKTRVMSVPEVQKWLAENGVAIDTLTLGNNMKTGELARFFNSARFQGEPITVHEQRLYDWLVQMQLLREEDSGVAVVDPERILISVPQASSVAGCAACNVNSFQRAVILQHELSHARFATDTVYQNYVLWFWSNSMTLVQRDKFQRFLRARGYDSSIRELCANEMQAFLMHTPDPHIFSPADVGMADSEIAELRRRFQDGLSPKPRAAAVDKYQFE
jgi:hypothetical protein